MNYLVTKRALINQNILDDCYFENTFEAAIDLFSKNNFPKNDLEIDILMLILNHPKFKIENSSEKIEKDFNIKFKTKHTPNNTEN